MNYFFRDTRQVATTARRVIGVISCTMCTLLWSNVSLHAQCTGLCGDVNEDGILSAADVTALFSLVNSNQESIDSADCGDIDGHELVTLRDFVSLARHVYSGGPAPACPVAGGPVVPQVSPDVEIRYESLLPAGASTMTVKIELTTARTLQALGLPLRVRVEGETPELGPANVGDRLTWNTAAYRILGAEGTALLNFGNLRSPVEPGTYTLTAFQVSMPPATVHRKVTLEWADLPPTMNGQPVNYPMAIDEALNAVAPNLLPCALTSTGDVNNDDVWSSADIIQLINYVFKAGNEPQPCVAAGDVDCSGAVGTSDIIAMVSFTFQGGAPPCDACPLLTTGVWTCP